MERQALLQCWKPPIQPSGSSTSHWLLLCTGSNSLLVHEKTPGLTPGFLYYDDVWSHHATSTPEVWRPYQLHIICCFGSCDINIFRSICLTYYLFIHYRHQMSTIFFNYLQVFHKSFCAGGPVIYVTGDPDHISITDNSTINRSCQIVIHIPIDIIYNNISGACDRISSNWCTWRNAFQHDNTKCICLTGEHKYSRQLGIDFGIPPHGGMPLIVQLCCLWYPNEHRW